MKNQLPNNGVKTIVENSVGHYRTEVKIGFIHPEGQGSMLSKS